MTQSDVRKYPCATEVQVIKPKDTTAGDIG